ncbi:MAG: hypothetical protein ACJ8AO_20700, partial [Gemmatimonadaceae bacterium]
PDAGELFVLPSGSEPIDYEELLRHPRWRRLASGFREVGALLVLAAPASAPHVAELVAATDGAVLVGELVPRELPVAKVLGGVRAPRAGRGAVLMPTPDVTPTAVPTAPPTRSRGRVLQLTVAAALVLALVAVGLWLAGRPLANGPRPQTEPTKDTTGANRVAGITPGASTTALDSLAVVDTSRPPGAVAGPVTNPADSARAVAWAVAFKNFNTQAGVLLTLHSARNALPAATFAPVQQQGSRWYQLVAGAFANRRSADSLLVVARDSLDSELEPVSVVRLPFAYLVQARVNTANASRIVGQLVERGHPAYALRQPDGTVNIYVGAFESPAQAALLLAPLQASGLTPALTYRVGRVY